MIAEHLRYAGRGLIVIEKTGQLVSPRDIVTAWNTALDAHHSGDAVKMREVLARIASYEEGIRACIESGHPSGIDWEGITSAMIDTAKTALEEQEGAANATR